VNLPKLGGKGGGFGLGGVDTGVVPSRIGERLVFGRGGGDGKVWFWFDDGIPSAWEKLDCMLATMEVSLAISPWRLWKAARCRSRRRPMERTSRGTRWRSWASSCSSSVVVAAPLFRASRAAASLEEERDLVLGGMVGGEGRDGGTSRR
jgi:hypothetical protein